MMKEESPKRIFPLPASAMRPSPSVPGREQSGLQTKPKPIDETFHTCPCIRRPSTQLAHVRRGGRRNLRHRPGAYLGRLHYLALFHQGAWLFWQAEGNDRRGSRQIGRASRREKE